jgi:glycosyltransferase involved in cell wall biosynthesis
MLHKTSAPVRYSSDQTLAQHKSPNGDSLAAGTVLIVSPGGLEHGGGIGRQMGYFLRAREGRKNGIVYRVIDSRGPWFLGSSPLYTACAGLYLAAAMMKLLWARLFASACLAHVNITGRGSTIRKIILLTFARELGLRYLLHVHDYDYADEYGRHGAFMQRLVARIFRGAVKVVVLGGRDQRLLSSLLELPLDRVTVLHNAVPDPELDFERARPQKSPCHLLFLGHLSARKGVPELLQALASPLLASRRWCATLAGGGPVDEFRNFADGLGILESVNFPGWVDEAGVKALAAKADILVLPSHAEGLAMSVLEGLSYGLVVITTPVGAHTEVIEPGVSGILVPPGNIVALAEALARVIDDDGFRGQLGRGARRRFLEKFDVRGYAERLGQLHVDLLSHTHQAGQPIRKEQVS